MHRAWAVALVVLLGCASSVSPSPPSDTGATPLDAPADERPVAVMDAATDVPRPLDATLDAPPPPDVATCGRPGLPCCFGAADACDDRSQCVQGRCVACEAGEGVCDGRCVRLNGEDNCGRCGNSCRGEGVRRCCVAGACAALACNADFADCDGQCANGCETSTATSVNHCGACGRACSLPHATAACAGGACVVERCDQGWGNCDGNMVNGCEVYVWGDTRHCGRCGTVCTAPPGAFALCEAGTCRVPGCTATPGFGDCDGNVANGCETRLGEDICHCGGCDRQCAIAGVTSMRCEAGRCVGGPCMAGLGDCDGSAATGCEAELASNRFHCGRCGNSCAEGQVCEAGACRCAPGRTPCGSACVDLARDRANCGACGRSCAAGQVCSRGACAATCAPEETMCGGSCAELQRDDQNCGACGRQCPAGFPCAFGNCGFLGCPAGQTVCGASCVDLTTDARNCGMCGARCPTGAVCQAGQCFNLACRRM